MDKCQIDDLLLILRNYFPLAHFVERADQGFDDPKRMCYVRPIGENGAEYELNDDMWEGRYLLIAKDNNTTGESLVQTCIGFVSDAGFLAKNASRRSETIYLEETGQKLTSESVIISVEFISQIPAECLSC